MQIFLFFIKISAAKLILMFLCDEKRDIVTNYRNFLTMNFAMVAKHQPARRPTRVPTRMSPR